MYKRVLLLICLLSMLFFPSCDNGSNVSSDNLSSESESSSNISSELVTTHSNLLGINFKHKQSCSVDDINTEPLIIVHLEQERYILIGQCDDLSEGVELLEDYMLEDVLRFVYDGDFISTYGYKNYNHFKSDSIEYSRISMTIESDYSVDFGKKMYRYNTYFFIRLNSGKMLFAICCDDEKYSLLDDYSAIIESIEDKKDSISGLKAIDGDRLDEILILEKDYYGGNEY